MKIIDTHTTVKELIAAGFPEKQAEILVDTFRSRGLDTGSYVYLVFVIIVLVILMVRLALTFRK